MLIRTRANTYAVEEIQGAAELAVREMLKTIYATTAGEPLHAIDYMDDGTPIELKVTIDARTGGAVFDFDGTGPEAYGNCECILQFLFRHCRKQQHVTIMPIRST